MQDERALVERAIGGDSHAFDELLSEHESRMYAVALRMCANREDAQDCLQEAMLRIYRALSNFKWQSSFSTWVYRVTMNACLDELRRRKVRKASSLDAMLDMGWAPMDESASPEEQASASERRRAISRGIQALPEDMRAAIVLRDVQGFSYEEIAEIVDTNVGTVKSRISRGREKLREYLSSAPELFG